ncbi:MAG: toprim domain-containing protein [Vallitaleaceae bacterium]|nr:toprim domain-containing protein [Vallitaleaceae bacterium]
MKKISNNSYKIPGYGGLFISTDGLKWNWFSQNKGGGAIQFVMEFEGKTWVDAVNELLGITHDELLEAPKVIDTKVKGKLVLPEKNDTYKHLFAYLIKSRRLDKDIVSEFVNKKMLYEDRNRNCVFVGYNDQQEPAYASLRSTRTVGESFKGDAKNSDKSWSFYYQGLSDTVCVFESPIDMMSYLTLLKLYDNNEFEHHLISLGGVTDKSLERFLESNSSINSIMLCLDNDQAGHLACQKIHKKYGETYKILRHKPNEKDFNEDLCIVKEEMKLNRVREPPTNYFEEEDCI